jgi:restriction endonuclease S subunit
LISSSGQAGYISRYPSKLWASDCWSIHSNDENYLTNDYLYHVLKYLQETIYEYQTGAVIKHIAFKDIKILKIPVPPLEVQNRIVEQLDNIYETEIQSSKEVIKSLQFSIEAIMKNTMYRDDLEEYKIKDIIITKRGNLCKPSENSEENIYPYYAGDKISGYTNTSEFSGPAIMMNYRLSLGSKRPCQYIRDGDYNCSRFSWVCTLNSENILSYIYNYFNNIINYDDLLVGSTILEINQRNLGNYKIHIPPPEIQREILKKIEPKERLINHLEKNIIRAENEAKEIMSILFN